MTLNLAAHPHPEWQASYHFMEALRKIKPEVLEDLRDNVPPWKQSERLPDGRVVISIAPSRELVAWADRWGINSQPILNRASLNVSAWANHGPGPFRRKLMTKPTSNTRQPARWGHYPEDF